MAHARGEGYPVGDLVQQGDLAARQQVMRSWTTRVNDVREVYVGRFIETEIMFGDMRYNGES
jgi:hypothetical protein